ncbi:hypothetical protein BC936DRAFT_141447 [Jimgerdemannia flammicorona]|uniref:Uncharacterized protein n=1 Tax=Jimgerdemannia flammicorona TaxID=994334 RepID=A0A433A275_9FUNG|nr:hypothetical protein BC936DRAFT_141447 [Jimgerdemannia flammicorona]
MLGPLDPILVYLFLISAPGTLNFQQEESKSKVVADFWEYTAELQRREKLGEEIFSLHFEGFAELMQNRKKRSTRGSGEEYQEHRDEDAINLDKDIDTDRKCSNRSDNPSTEDVERGENEVSSDEHNPSVEDDENKVTMKTDKRLVSWIPNSLIEDEDLLINFKAFHKEFENGKKFTLKSGRNVEDVIYNYGLTLKHEDVLHSFVLNTDDKRVRGVFSADEWLEILETNVENKEAPVVDSDLLHHIARYRKTNARDLRKVMNTSWYQKENCYDAEKEFNYTWIHNCISNLLTLYEIKPQAFQAKHLERWYDTNVWSSVIDQCMWNLKNVELIRGESFSIASNTRKSENRILGDRKPVGHRADGILRMELGRQEYGATEHGRLFLGENDTKFLLDGRKLVKMLKDMLRNVSGKSECLKNIEMVGYLHSERTLQIFVLDYLGGYMLRLRKGPIYEIPQNLENIDDLLKLMAAVLSSKLRIVRTACLLQIPGQQDEQAFLEELLATSQIDRSSSKDDVRLPPTLPTPKKRRIK